MCSPGTSAAEAWEREWTEHPDGYGLPIDENAKAQLAELNILRKRAIAPFSALREALAGEQPAGDCVRALYAFLLAVDAPQRMTDRAAGHEQAGRLAAGRRVPPAVGNPGLCDGAVCMGVR